MKTPKRSFITLAMALALFGLAGSVVAAIVPPLVNNYSPSDTPPFTVFLVVGLAVILLTAGLFYAFDRLGLGFGKTALALAAGYNALIAVVKFGLAPAALYQANQQAAFEGSIENPNSLIYQLGVGLTMFLLYLGVFTAMYYFFRYRLRRHVGETTVPGRMALRTGLVILLIIALGAAVGGSGVLFLPFLVMALPAFSYLTNIFVTFGAVIAVALGLAFVLAYLTFDRVEKQAAGLREATVLASFFWLGAALIFLYHAMWVVFILTLVGIWPFRTYTPK